MKLKECFYALIHKNLPIVCKIILVQCLYIFIGIFPAELMVLVFTELVERKELCLAGPSVSEEGCNPCGIFQGGVEAGDDRDAGQDFNPLGNGPF